MKSLRLTPALPRLALALTLLSGAALSACSGLLPSLSQPTSIPATATLTLPAPTTAAPTQPTPSPTPTPGPLALRVWVPPEFDPNANTTAGQLLEARLAEFSEQNPGVVVEARVKAVEGPGGMLDTLTTASAAAPLALPDLVALPQEALETAALKGLLRPFSSDAASDEGNDWYPYARQLGRIQNSTFGIPFAGDALALIYRPVIIGEPPLDWDGTLMETGPFVFPAADPQALFTLAQYQAQGGEILDEQGRPAIDPAVLTNVLTFYQSALTIERVPAWLTDFQTDEQVWATFEQNTSHMVVTWSSRFLGEMQADMAITSLPTPGGEPLTLATGWVWALASSQPERQEAAVELAEFLTEAEFLAGWTEAAGYLPTRPSSLAGWSSPALQAVVGEIVTSARLYPSTDILTSLGPAIQEAVLQVLKKQSEPANAAQAAAAALSARQ